MQDSMLSIASDSTLAGSNCWYHNILNLKCISLLLSLEYGLKLSKKKGMVIGLDRFLFLIIGNNECPDSYKQNLRNAKNGLINLANANRTRY